MDREKIQYNKSKVFTMLIVALSVGMFIISALLVLTLLLTVWLNDTLLISTLLVFGVALALFVVGIILMTVHSSRGIIIDRKGGKIIYYSNFAGLALRKRAINLSDIKYFSLLPQYHLSGANIGFFSGLVRNSIRAYLANGDVVKIATFSILKGELAQSVLAKLKAAHSEGLEAREEGKGEATSTPNPSLPIPAKRFFVNTHQAVMLVVSAVLVAVPFLLAFLLEPFIPFDMYILTLVLAGVGSVVFIFSFIVFFLNLWAVEVHSDKIVFRNLIKSRKFRREFLYSEIVDIELTTMIIYKSATISKCISNRKPVHSHKHEENIIQLPFISKKILNEIQKYYKGPITK